MSIDDVAEKLCLSTEQINCLESGSLSKFYGDWHLMRAANKYAGIVGADLDMQAITRSITAQMEQRVNAPENIVYRRLQNFIAAILHLR